jgi:hopene-associated glycosyltransferase HpnB
MTVVRIVAAIALAIWLYLILGRGFFWRTSVRLPAAIPLDRWPSVAAVVPARNEAGVLPRTLPTLLAQHYPGRFEVVVVDDDSDDGTGELARAAGARVVRVAGPPAGWAGKVAAMAAGVVALGEGPEYLLLTDADIEYPPDALTELVAGASGRDLVSQMARLRCDSGWERWLVPAFVYFFAQLYPFSWVNGRGRTAAAAGGCMLVRRAALEAAGGLAEIRGAVIDDVSLGRLLKRRGRIWLGLSSGIASVRPYPGLADLWLMVARSAYTQLRCSPPLLLGTVLALALTYVVPPATFLVGVVSRDPVLAGLGGGGWVMMTATFLPMVRFYGLAWTRAAALPIVAGLYAVMTVDSARRHRAGRGAEWKGRSAGGTRLEP